MKGHSAHCIVVIALVDHVLLFSSGENVGFQDCDNEMQKCEERARIPSELSTLKNQITQPTTC